MKKLLFLGAIFVGTQFGLTAATAQTGLDIAKYCQTILGSSASAATYSLDQPDSWYCQVGNIKRTTDLNAVCQLEAGANAYAVLSGDSKTPAYNWRCVKH